MSRYWSRTYATPLSLEPCGSRTLWRLVLLLHVLALPAVATAQLPLPARGLLAVAVLCALAWQLRKTRTGPLRRFTWLAGSACRVELADGTRLQARLEPRAVVHPRLVILYYRSGRRRVRALLLLPDMLDPVTWRRLRVRLNTQLQQPDEQTVSFNRH
jgi:hypothetical protein